MSGLNKDLNLKAVFDLVEGVEVDAKNWEISNALRYLVMADMIEDSEFAWGNPRTAAKTNRDGAFVCKVLVSKFLAESGGRLHDAIEMGRTGRRVSEKFERYSRKLKAELGVASEILGAAETMASDGEYPSKVTEVLLKTERAIETVAVEDRIGRLLKGRPIQSEIDAADEAREALKAGEYKRAHRLLSEEFDSKHERIKAFREKMRVRNLPAVRKLRAKGARRISVAA